MLKRNGENGEMTDSNFNRPDADANQFRLANAKLKADYANEMSIRSKNNRKIEI